MQIICPACTPPTQWESEKEYKDHLITFHGTNSSDEAMKIEREKRRNTPVNLPPGVPPKAAPTPEFIEMMKQVESKNQPPTVVTPLPQIAVPLPVKQVEKPIELKYKYEGNCSCGQPVKTIMIDLNGVLFATAYCLFEDRVVKQVKVAKIEDDGVKEKAVEVPVIKKNKKKNENNN